MSDNNSIGFFAAVWRFISFYKIRKALGIARAADDQFTKSAGGISDAFDIEHDNLVGDYKSLMGAVAQAEAALETKRGRVKEIAGKIGEKQKLFNGAVAIYRNNVNATDDAGKAKAAKAQADGTTFKQAITDLTAEAERIEADIKAQEPNITRLMTQLSAMQRRISELPSEKAAAVSEFVSNKAIIEANERLNNLKTARERSPLDAVKKALNEQSAAARVSSKLSGIDTAATDAEYLDAGTKTTAQDDFMSAVAAADAKHAEATGQAAPSEKDRPQI